MLYRSVAAAALVMLFGATAEAAPQVYGTASDGKVYSIDVSTGALSATGNPTHLNSDPVSDPNSLGYDGNFYTSSFADPSVLYVNGANTGFSLGGKVASAFALNGNYYYVTNAGEFKVVNNAASNTRSFGSTTNLGIGSVEFGDIVWDAANSKVIASYGPGQESATFATFNIDGSLFNAVGTAGQGKFAGLAFAGNTLYGVTAGNPSVLYMVNLLTGLKGTGVNVSAFITDLATVPLPAAAWLLLSGILGLFGLKRFNRRQQIAGAAA